MPLKKTTLLLLFLFLLGSSSTFAQCERLSNKRIYQLLGASEYDNSRISEIKTLDYSMKEEYQIDLFKGVVYKLVFDVYDDLESKNCKITFRKVGSEFKKISGISIDHKTVKNILEKMTVAK